MTRTALPKWYRDPLIWLLLALLLPVIVWVLAQIFVQLVGAERLAKLDASAWASWVQAIGSIGAIGAATFVVVLQHSLEVARERRAKTDAARRQLAMAMTLVSTALEFCTKAKVWLPRAVADRLAPAGRAMTGELRSLLAGCERIDPVAVGTDYAAAEILNLESTIRGFLEYTTSFSDAEIFKVDNLRQQFLRYIMQREDRLRRAQARFGKAFSKLPPDPEDDGSLEIEFRIELRSMHDWE